MYYRSFPCSGILSLVSEVFHACGMPRLAGLSCDVKRTVMFGGATPVRGFTRKHMHSLVAKVAKASKKSGNVLRVGIFLACAIDFVSLVARVAKASKTSGDMFRPRGFFGYMFKR